MKEKKYKYSINDICELLNISRQAVNQRINNTGVKGIRTAKRRQRFFSELEYILIRNNSIDVKRVDVIYVTQTYHIYESKINFMV